jgi:anti-sigma B factor antagonist
MLHRPDPAPARVDTQGIRPPAAFEIVATPLRQGLALLLLRGELDLAAAASLRSQVDSVAGMGLIIDLREVTFVDSSALRELLHARDALERRGGRLVLSGVPSAVQRLLELTGTAELFDTAPTRAQAIRRFTGD